MKTSRHQIVARRKRRIERRLRPRTWTAQATPMYRASNIQYEHSDALGTQRTPDPTTSGDFCRRFDEARALCRAAGFQRITFRGDTDFSQRVHARAGRASASRIRFARASYPKMNAGELKNLRLTAEAIAEFAYQPIACTQPYRIVVVRKNISVEQGDQRLFDEIRYFFYLINDQENPGGRRRVLGNDRATGRIRSINSNTASARPACRWIAC